MICLRCLRATQRAPQRAPPTGPLHTLRTLTTSTPLSNATPVTTETTETALPRSTSGAPAATSTPGVSQPFSTPLEPSPSNLKLPTQTKQTKTPLRITSSCPAGTVLKGLNFTKGATDPVAKKDDDYPAWLWNVLANPTNSSDAAAAGKAADEGDLFSKSKKQRRLAAKRLRKLEAENPEALAPKVPVFEQSVDLNVGDAGTVEGRKGAAGVRGELTKAMRGERRRRIKEANFLKAMA